MDSLLATALQQILINQRILLQRTSPKYGDDNEGQAAREGSARLVYDLRHAVEEQQIVKFSDLRHAVDEEQVAKHGADQILATERLRLQAKIQRRAARRQARKEEKVLSDVDTRREQRE